MKSNHLRSLIVLMVASLALASCTVAGTTTPTTSASNPTDNPTSPTTAPVVTEVVGAATQSSGEEAYPAASGAETVDSAASGYPNQMPEGALFQLVLADGSVLYPTNVDLGKLTPVTITADGQEKSGVKLSDLLNLYGISGYQSVLIDGATYSAELGVDQVNDQVILEPNADATSVNLVAASLAADAWVMSVSKITLR